MRGLENGGIGKFRNNEGEARASRIEVDGSRRPLS
jgi:hypothetical protein